MSAIVPRRLRDDDFARAALRAIAREDDDPPCPVIWRAMDALDLLNGIALSPGLLECIPHRVRASIRSVDLGLWRVDADRHRKPLAVLVPADAEKPIRALFNSGEPLMRDKSGRVLLRLDPDPARRFSPAFSAGLEKARAGTLAWANRKRLGKLKGKARGRDPNAEWYRRNIAAAKTSLAGTGTA